jgi:hypothetical protein
MKAKAETERAKPSPNSEGTRRVAQVELRGRNLAAIDGTTKTLNSAQYDVIDALINARPTGLTLNSLKKKSAHTDARGILRRLRDKDKDWETVIRMAGRPYGHYHVD